MFARQTSQSTLQTCNTIRRSTRSTAASFAGGFSWCVAAKSAIHVSGRVRNHDLIIVGQAFCLFAIHDAKGDHRSIPVRNGNLDKCFLVHGLWSLPGARNQNAAPGPISSGPQRSIQPSNAAEAFPFHKNCHGLKKFGKAYARAAWRTLNGLPASLSTCSTRLVGRQGF